ncbi:HCNGP-like protein [Babesia microti strain RI]|uniref:HCNGP-like protein n=1 Tax=Babesia microti (strain RI) TaxID=1133968 RepID=A0A1N6LXN0_BABMR|nr:HCNGP-like protein [Babesia microti strain RI]SIO73624.1 HCNGP-like protein [Babesia microti strain RI]|eukprot:XP_021337705.1 HCNGP-like protein [Babesia microti strain RI]
MVDKKNDEGKMPIELKNVIDKLWDFKNRGISINCSIENSLEFKNPYLLEKIMRVFEINQPNLSKCDSDKE